MSSLSDLLLGLGSPPIECHMHSTPLDYLYVSFAREGMYPQANVLYICEETTAGAFLSYSSCGIVLMDGHQLNSPDIMCEYCVIPKCDQIDLMCKMQERIIFSQRKSRLRELAQRTMVSVSSPKSVVHSICEIVGNPIAVFDASYNRVYMDSLGLPVNHKVWNMAREKGAFTPEIVEEFRETIGDHDISKLPFLCATHAWEDMHCLVMQLVSRSGRLLGSIAVYEAFRSFISEDIGIVEEIAEIIVNLLEKDGIISAGRNSVASLIQELSNGDSIDSAELERRCKDCGWGEFSFYAVGYISLQNDYTKARQRDYFCKELSDVSENTVALVKDKNILVLFRVREMSKLRYSVKKLEPVLHTHGLTMGISRCFTDLSELHQMYASAREAIKLGAKLDDSPPVIYSQDAMLYSLISGIDMQKIRSIYSTTSYATIKAFDRAQDTNYCETLTEYFTSMFSSTLTAEKLFIHKNSLLYRLSRVETIFGLDLNKFYDVFDFWVGYKLYLYINRFDPDSIAN